MGYVDGFLLAVPRKKLKQYLSMAKKAGKIWREHGALDYKECVGDDLKIEGMTSFLKTAQAKSNEVILYSFIVYKSRKHRDSVNAKVMKDPRIAKMCGPEKAPFDIKRMSYGGFKVAVDE